MMLAMAIGTINAVGDAQWSGAATHSAIKGQSLLQSGSDGLPGQQGIWSIASAEAESPGAAASIAIGVSIAIAGRTIGASNRPATATDAKNRPMAARILTPCSYHIRRFVHSGRLTRLALCTLSFGRRPCQ
jgi:hypothetical protein